MYTQQREQSEIETDDMRWQAKPLKIIWIFIYTYNKDLTDNAEIHLGSRAKYEPLTVAAVSW